MKQYNPLNRALVISKFQSRWHNLLEKKLAKIYDVKIIYIKERVKSRGFKGIGSYVSEILKSENRIICFLDLEFYFAVGLEEVAQISPLVRLVALSFDDITFHELNVLQNFPVDLVLAADPVAVIKYREKKIPADLFLLENSADQIRSLPWSEKKRTIFFYGSLCKGGRAEKLQVLRDAGFQIDVHDSDKKTICYIELCRMMSQAKIILNFSVSAKEGKRFSFLPFDCFSQFKGRVIEAGLAGAICVSEYAPSIELLFPGGEVPMFNQIEEAVPILNELLNNEENLKEKADRFHNVVLNKYSEKVQMEKLAARIANLPLRGRPVPDWLPSRYVKVLLQERVILPYAVDSWPLKNSIMDFLYLLTGKNLLSVAQRLLIIWLVLTAVAGKCLTKPARIFRKILGRCSVSA